MKDYKDTDVLAVLEQVKFISATGKEHFDKYKCYTDYIITDNKIYSREQINSMSEKERDSILSFGLCANEPYIHSLMKHQHLVDNNATLEIGQRELLRILLKSEVYFLPFCFGDWSEMHVIEKVTVVKLLLDGKWTAYYYVTSLDDDVYYIGIKFNKYRNIKDFLKEHIVKNDEDLDTFKNLEIYISYSDFVSIYKNVFNSEKSDFWEESLKKIDYMNSKRNKDSN